MNFTSLLQKLSIGTILESKNHSFRAKYLDVNIGLHCILFYTITRLIVNTLVMT